MGLHTLILAFFWSRIGFSFEQREAKYAKNHFQRNRYSVFESHVMRLESSQVQKILRYYDNMEVE